MLELKQALEARLDAEEHKYVGKMKAGADDWPTYNRYIGRLKQIDDLRLEINKWWDAYTKREDT